MTENQQTNTTDRASGIPSLRKRVRRTQVRLRNLRVGGLLLLAVQATAVWLALLFLCDLAFQPPWQVRLGILAVSVAAAAVWIVRRIPTVEVPLLEAAEQIEQTHPELREAVVNAIQLDDARQRDELYGSSQLTAVFLQQAEEHAGLVRPSSAVSYRVLRQPAIRSLVFVFAMMVLLGISPATTGVFLQRVFALQTPGTVIVSIQPGDVECVEGSSLVFVGVAAGVIPSSGQVRLTYEDQNVEVIPLHPDGTGFTSLPLVPRDSATYRLELGRAVSREYSIRLIRHPRMEVSLVAMPPDYAGLEPQTVAGARARFLVGSQVQLIVNGSKNLASGNLRTSDGELPLAQTDPQRFETTISLDATVTGKLEITDVDGLSVSEPLSLEAVPDSPPVVVLNHGLPEMCVLAGSALELAYDLRDDLGLKAIEIHGLWEQEDALLATVPIPEQTSASGTIPLALASWLQAPGDRMDVYALVTDNSPVGQTGRSELVTIRVVSPREAEQIVAANRGQLAERLADAARASQQVRDLAAEERWAEAVDLQQRVTSDLSEIQDQASQAWDGGLSPDGTISFEQQRFHEQVEAAREASRQVAESLQNSLRQPQSPMTEQIHESQQQLEGHLRIAQALADPQAATQAIRDQVQDLVENTRDREPLPSDADPQTAGERAEFWGRQQQQMERLQQDVQQAKEQGIGEAAPLIHELEEALQASKAAETMSETKRALERMDIARAQELEQQLERDLLELDEMLESDTALEETAPGESARSGLGHLISQQQQLLDASPTETNPEQIAAQEAITDGIRQWMAAAEAEDEAAAECLDQAEGFSIDAEQQLAADEPRANVRQSQQQVLESLQQAASARRASPEELLAQAQSMQQLLADTEQLREQQDQLQDQVRNNPSPDPAEQAEWQAEQQQIADAARELAEQAESLDAGAAAELQRAAEAAAEAPQSLAQKQRQQAGEQQAASRDQLDAAAKKLAGGLEQSLKQCEQAASAQEQMAQELRQEVNRLQQQQEQANQAGSPQAAQASQSQVTKQCEQLAQQCEQAGAGEMAQAMQQAAEASRQAEQSQSGGQPSGQSGGQSGSPQGGSPSGSPGSGQSGSPQQQTAQHLSSAEQAAKQMESQAAGAKAAAVAAGTHLRQQQQLDRMADQQQSASQPGVSPPTPADAARQQSLARQARSMAQQIPAAEAREPLEQAADAADAAAQAIERGETQTARDSQSLSAQRLREARRAMSRPSDSGDGRPGQTDGRSPVADMLLIDVPPEMRQQVRALFDSQKPNAYAEQLLEYSTKLRIDASSEGTSP